MSITASSNVAVGQASFAITPHDTTKFARSARAIYVGTTGNVALVHKDGTTCVWPSVPAGGYILCESVRVNATLTTASNLVGIV